MTATADKSVSTGAETMVPASSRVSLLVGESHQIDLLLDLRDQQTLSLTHIDHRAAKSHRGPVLYGCYGKRRHRPCFDHLAQRLHAIKDAG